MQSIILSLASRYALSTAEVIQEIESAFARQLSQWYRQEVMVFLREGMQLEVVTYGPRNGLPVQHILDLPAVLSRNQFTTILENHLAMAAVIKQVRLLKGFERRLLWGEVVRNRAGDHLLVETEIIPDEPIIAICPVNRIGLHERHTGRFQPGQRRAFHLRRIEPVLVNGTPRTKVILDRVSKTLTENLLRYYLGDAAHRFHFRCLTRYVGHKSVVLTTRRLPHQVIIAVDRELQERIEVRIVKALP
ncbi:hypothetical protein Despr_3130 [Desulfobulbus propionicus DSM 2032]|uniref:Uncharacterized protein n=1 Tax=Desulfobulbus propionicus (strain ATCC 33891 / DSM 2032 / VKM B-1956 / 1pr3) TaxID=577650 RepID=A0A7U3YPP3_DESPD|nr:hypothetical protein [Desulfobulbus propionicus]ADW19262.1 hypothetical protein Despr_3130 [Desulfobulbus propionicus DSM 2032]